VRRLAAVIVVLAAGAVGAGAPAGAAPAADAPAGAIAAADAPAGAAPAADAAAQKRCAKETRRLNAFRKGMAKAKRRFFRTHRSKKSRRAFAKRQAKRLKKLKRARARCRAGLKAPAPPAPPPPAPAPGPAPGPAPTATPEPTPPPGGLQGPAGASALGAVADVVTDDALVAAGEVSDGVVRTQIQLSFARDATVGAVNELLGRIGGRIVSSRAGVLGAVVEVPEPGSLAAHEALLASLAAEPVVRAALPAFLPPEDELPEHIVFGTSSMGFLRSQAAVRAPAAWNARAALAGRTPPTLVIADHFGDGAPGAGTDIALTGGAFDDNPRSSDHGYMVLGIAAGTYDANGTGSFADEAVTGMFPGRLPVRAVDVTAGFAGAVLHDRMLELVETAPGDVVVNTSLSGWPCATAAQAQAYCTQAFAEAAGAVWAEKVRGTDPDGGTNLEGRFLHVASAGNVEPVTGTFGAAVNSEWTAAALLPLQDAASGDAIPNLANTLVVENHVATATEPFEPGCAAASSELGGTVAGVGSPVHSFDSPGGSLTYADGGTSAATPQVSGLAAYAWALRPSLTPAELAAQIRDTARDAGCGAVIDAYAALLADDVGVAARPVRTAILDVADGNGDAGANGRFDGHDLDEFLGGFQALDGEVDYGRFDLNGDGVTRAEPGVTRREPVDLDADGGHQVVATELEGLPVRFDERALSDENVLCHAAYSPLWQGPLEQRREQLGLARCVDVRLSDTFPDQVQAGQANVLTITAVSGAIADEDGDRLPVEDVFLALEPSEGLTLGASSGTTNEDGVLATTATLAEGQTTVSIDVTAFDREGGEQLASHTITAQVVLAGTAAVDRVDGEVSCIAGSGDQKFVESAGGWSLSCADAGEGTSASVTANAALAAEGSVLRYTGSGTIDSTSNASALIGSTVAITVTGGPVRWSLHERMTGQVPSSSFLAGCYVNGTFRGISSGGDSGVLEPGEHQISHNCGGAQIDAAMEWTLTIGG
jgi:hypothetical protein